MVDLVITSVFPRKKWVAEKTYYKQLETGEVIKHADTNGECRYRDFGLLRFWLRTIEKNCNWYNKIFLIVQDEDQVPEWLDTTNPKIRVVYHREFIPEELLPTFSTNTIELHMHRIPDLSEHFLYFNDDMFILKPVKKDRFFRDGKPVYDYHTKPQKYRAKSNPFLLMLWNNKHLEDKYKKTNTVFVDSHLMHPMSKSFNTKIYNENKSIYNSVKMSRFRHEKNMTDWVYTDIMQLMGETYTDKNFMRNSTYTALKSYYVDFEPYFRKDLVCFNDTNNLVVERYLEVKHHLLLTFLKHYPKPSQFEKPDMLYILKGEYEKDLKLDNRYHNILVSDVDQPNISHDVLKVKDINNID